MMVYRKLLEATEVTGGRRHTFVGSLDDSWLRK
jgi:hypothetical protein